MSDNPAGKMPARPDKYHDEPFQPYWPTFIEKLLLTIIDAHPRSPNGTLEGAASKERQRRLNAVLKILLGVPARRGNRRIYQLPALIAATREPAMTDSMRAFEIEVLGLPESERTPRISRRSTIEKSANLLPVPTEALESSVLKGVSAGPAPICNGSQSSDPMRRKMTWHKISSSFGPFWPDGMFP